MRKRSAFLVVTALLAWMGCNQLFGLEQAREVPEPRDAAADAPAEPADADAGDAADPLSGPITVSKYRYFIRDNNTGTEQQGVDFTDAGLVAHVQLSDGGETLYPGTGGNGTGTISDVPPGAEYYVRIDSKEGTEIVFTKLRNIDLSSYRVGRSDVVLAQPNLRDPPIADRKSVRDRAAS
jgi:hypothetical protein